MFGLRQGLPGPSTSRPNQFTQQYTLNRPAQRIRFHPVLAKDGQKNVQVITAKNKWHTENGLVVPITFPQLMGLRGRSLYLDAQMSSAYDEQMATPVDEGYSDVARRGREQLLMFARDGMRAARGRVSNMALETTIDPILLPGAMALLEKAGFYELVLQLSQQAALLDERDLRASNRNTVANFFRDVSLATALAHCGLAHQAFKKGQVALGCGRLEEALQVLKDGGAGGLLKGYSLNSPVAPELQRRIEAALMDFKAEAVLNYIKGPLNTESEVSLRPQAVAALSVMLSKPETAVRSDGSQPITPEYVASALEALSSEEVCRLLDWERVARHKSHYSWYYAGVLPHVSLAHVVCGFTHRRPAMIHVAKNLLVLAGGESDVAVHRAVCGLLLGDTDEAIWILEEDDRIGKALRGIPARSSSSSSAAGASTTSSDGTTSAPTTTSRKMLPPSKGPISFPSRDGILDFIHLYSPEDSDLTPGLCVFGEAWLGRLAFPRFRDTKAHAPSPSIAAYLDDPRVMAGLATHAATGAALHNLKQQLSKLKLKLPELPPARVLFAGVGVLAAAWVLNLLRGGLGSGVGVRSVSNGTSTVGGSTKIAATVKPAEVSVGSKLSTLAVSKDVQLSKDVVRHIVEQWLKIKAEAMGPRHQTSQLSTVLTEPMLSAVKEESHEAAESGWFWNIHPLKVRIDKVDTSKLTAKGGHAVAVAVVEESADLWASNGRKGDSYKTSYKVEYNLTRANGTWKIASALVLGY